VIIFLFQFCNEKVENDTIKNTSLIYEICRLQVNGEKSDVK